MATGSSSSSASKAKLDRLITQLKSMKLVHGDPVTRAIPSKVGSKGEVLKHESPNKKSLGSKSSSTDSTRDSSLSPKERLAVYFKNKKAEREARNSKDAEESGKHVDKKVDPAQAASVPNSYVLPDHVTCFWHRIVFSCLSPHYMSCVFWNN